MSEFPSFLRLNNISLYVYSTFAYAFNLLMDTSCLHILAVVNNTIKNMVYKYIFETAFNSFGYVYPEVKLLDHTIILILKIFFEPCCFPQWLLFYIHNRSMLFICLVVSSSLRPHGLQHTRLSCPSQSPGVCSNMSIEYDIQPSYPLSPSSPYVLNLSQHFFSSKSTLCIMWPKYWSFSFTINPSYEY